MRRARYWLLVLVLFLLLGGTAYFALRARLDAGKGLPDYSVFSDEDNGLHRIRRLTRPPASTTPGPRAPAAAARPEAGGRSSSRAT